VTYSIDITQPSDEGWYCCVATNECGDVEECAWLEVDSKLLEWGILFAYYCMLLLATPVIVTHPKSVVSKEGGTKISLSCSAHDYRVGHVKYNWEKYHPSDDKWIRPSVRHSRAKLIFSVITEQDEGVYRCIATNSDGSVVSGNGTITVYGELKLYTHKINFKAMTVCVCLIKVASHWVLVYTLGYIGSV